MLKYWTIKADRHYDVQPPDDSIYENAQPNPAVGKRSNIFPASTEPFPKHEELQAEVPNQELKSLLEQYPNPFDVPIEALKRACRST